MIVFDLKCAKGHAFEVWFDSSADYESKTAGGALACPKCGDANITKALMAPSIATGSSARQSTCEKAAQCGETTCPMAGRA